MAFVINLFIMEKLRYLITLSYCLVYVSCLNQEMASQINTAKSFVEAIMNAKMSDAEIIEQYIDLDSSATSNLELAKLQLQSLRDLIIKKSITSIDLSYTPISPNDSDIIISEGNLKNVIVVNNRNERLIPILFNSKDKIRSFATMNKGGKRVFIVL